MEINNNINNNTNILKTKFQNIELNGLLGNASGVMCEEKQDLNNLYNSNSAFIVTKSSTLKSRTGNEKPRYCAIPNGSINSMGLPNNSFEYYFDYVIHKMLNNKNTNNQKPMFLSVSGLSLKENLDIITVYNNGVNNIKNICIDESNYNILKYKLDNLFIEFNLSCPNVIGKPQVGYDFNTLTDYLNTIDNNVNTNYGVKLPPYFDISHFEQVSSILNKYDKLKFITCVNSIGNGLYIDIDSETTLIKPKNGFGGIGGDYILPTALANVHYFYKNCPNKEIIGCGGVKSYKEVIQHKLAGASLVQIGTALYENDYYHQTDIFEDINNNLIEYLKNKNYNNIDDLKGKLKYI